ncbi:hypothetical protein B0H11DRAFT_2208168 [Mycena galericulata]|nr:hypothetical protein B0H11DRAFT_2208168 [Mycena galericulata]
MAPPSSSAAAELIHTLRGTIIPALNLARAGVTGIGLPGVEGVLNGVVELAKTVSTMKGNKKDLAALKKSVDELAALKVPGATGDLETRLTTLSLKMGVRSEECKALGVKSGINRFWKGDEYSRKILDIRNGVADDIHEFTLHGNISIEMLVKDMAQKVLANQDIFEGVVTMQHHVNVAHQIGPRNDSTQSHETPIGTTQIMVGGTGGNGGNAYGHGIGGRGGVG